jgi:hypothetical protein
MMHGHLEVPMSDLASDPAPVTLRRPTQARSAASALPWEAAIFLEVDRLGLSLRLGRVQLYARSERASEWWTLREPGSVEWAAGRFRLTVSWPFAVRGMT